MAEMQEFLQLVIGSDANTITWWQMTIRALLIFAYGLVLVRIGGRREFGQKAALDIVLAVILGSVLSRALTANPLFIPSIAANHGAGGSPLSFWPNCIAVLRFGYVVKGAETLLVRDGAIDLRALKRANMTEHDLREALRINGIGDPSRVKAAYLERTGDVSAIM